VTEGRSRPGTVAPSIGVLRGVLLLVHAADASPDPSVASPEQPIAGASDWFRTVSYSRLELRVETIPRWLSLPRRSTEYAANPSRYINDAVAAADPYVDFSTVDVVYLAPSSNTPETVTFASLNSFGAHADGREVRLWIPFGAGFAGQSGDRDLLLHETGHLLGLPDLYVAGVPSSFHRWDVMAARYPAELLGWHRWKLGWLDAGEIVCIAGRSSRSVTLTPLGHPGGTKAVFVKRGSRVLAVEVRDRTGYDRTLCRTGVLVYEVDQTAFRRSPVRLFAARSDRSPPRRDCGARWNAPYGVGGGAIRTLHLAGVRVDVLARRAGGSYRVRVVSR
jgi:M6 family metalloprotease-like protein